MVHAQGAKRRPTYPRTMHGAGKPDRFVRDGLVILDRRSGAGAGPPFVLVHGIGLGCSSYSRLAPLLAEHAEVHVVELPGFGDAPSPPHAMTVQEHGALLAAFLETIGRPAVLVGHSMGAQVVLEAAVLAGGLVERLVLIGPVTDPGERGMLMQAFRLAQDTLGETPATNAMVLSEYVRCGPRRYLATTPSMLAYGTEAAAAAVTAPVLVVRGGRDPICRRSWGRRLASVARVGRLVVVPGAHHVAVHTHPRAVASAILHAGPR